MRFLKHVFERVGICDRMHLHLMVVVVSWSETSCNLLVCQAPTTVLIVVINNFICEVFLSPCQTDLVCVTAAN